MLSVWYMSQCIKKETSYEGHLRDCPIDQVDEWCLARRDAMALLI